MCSAPEPLDDLFDHLRREYPEDSTVEPSRYREHPAADGALRRADDARHELFRSLDIRQSLDALRSLALMCQSRHCKHAQPQRELAYAWVRTLVTAEGAARSSFLLRNRVSDATFYRAVTDPQPKRRSNWPPPWQSQLPFLDHPHELTVTELELALAIFDWSQPSPAFVWWLKQEPHILWRIHDFLLNRYAFYLLPLFETALEEAGLDRPPYRAGEGLLLAKRASSLRTRPPRLIGLTALGYLGLITVDSFIVFVFAGNAAVVLLATGAGLWGGHRLYHMDVFKQNRGVLASLEHARGRIRQAFRLALGWSAALAPGVFGFWFALGWLGTPSADGRFADFGEGALGGMIVPYVIPAWPLNWVRIGELLAGFLALGAAAIVIGALVQWFWQDESAIEPI